MLFKNRAIYLTRVAGVSFGAIIGAGCGRGSPAPAPGPAPLGPVSSDALLLNDNVGGGIRDSTQLVIRDAAALTVTWKQVTAPQSNPTPLPAIDFTRDMVVVVAAGRMARGDEIHVDSAGVRREPTVSGKQQNVFAILYKVTEGCGRFNRDAYPVEIVKLPRSSNEVRFIGKRERGPACR